MDEYTLELVDRFAALLEENTQLRTRLALLEDTVKAAEIEDALYQERNKGASWVSLEYGGRLDTERINMIMGWKRSREAENIIARLKKEKKEEKNGDAV